jgi:hypothetical protein
MSDIGLIMNGLLGVLLIGALALGWRLEGRLKALRASHESFARAVGDLDRAAARAEQGLADLRAATDEAAESLAGRIERAKSLSAKLEGLTREATNVEARLAAKPQPAVARETAFARFAERYGAAPKASAPPLAVAPPRSDLILEDDDERPFTDPPQVSARLERLRHLAQLRASLQAGGRDDELFEAPTPRRVAGSRR